MRTIILFPMMLALLEASCNSGVVKEQPAGDSAKVTAVSCGGGASRAGRLAHGGKATMQVSNLGYAIPATADTAHWPPRPWPAGMVWIPGGSFIMGGVGSFSRKDEFPQHRVALDGFWMDQTELTNAAFAQFIQATHFVTVAEQKPQWEELKQQLPPGTPKPDDALLVAGAMVFTPTQHAVDLNDYSQWWRYVPGVNWRNPDGAGNQPGLEKHPVVQICWTDALAYAQWAGKALPTEAQWEYAARGGKEGREYGWDETVSMDEESDKANIWQGSFPYRNTQKDGYVLSAPVASYEANAYGLYDMMGNVWEWCNDWYRPDTYKTDLEKGTVHNPQGPAKSYDPDEPYAPKRVVRGGSFLCNAAYCASYRPSARMKTSPDSGENHTGFRCVLTDAAWRKLLEQHTQLAQR
ncbi:formylglycine-generating enzyme family protein [Deminuibacter soli]|uniref:Formylglycine-generating enzyme family protein n=1 Tax=Deminuibacter soli TaxID=2291815 RepID=A0A3E1NHG4_9BACT|nr:formylglycine-generating enzyme family protein [Deminuibacter soli]RFM27294.1 formylglycine-generating enzyme family protein [Deminuibacter soli]